MSAKLCCKLSKDVAYVAETSVAEFLKLCCANEVGPVVKGLEGVLGLLLLASCLHSCLECGNDLGRSAGGCKVRTVEVEVDVVIANFRCAGNVRIEAGSLGAEYADRNEVAGVDAYSCLRNEKNRDLVVATHNCCTVLSSAVIRNVLNVDVTCLEEQLGSCVGDGHGAGACAGELAGVSLSSLNYVLKALEAGLLGCGYDECVIACGAEGDKLLVGVLLGVSAGVTRKVRNGL